MTVVLVMGLVSFVHAMEDESTPQVASVKPIPMKDAFRIFESQPELLEVNKQAIVRHYLVKDGNGVTGIECEMGKSFEPYDFKTITNPDVFYVYRLLAKDPAIGFIKNFCEKMRRDGFKVVLFSGRRAWKEGLEDATIRNLIERCV